MNIYYVYKITNKVTGRMYIGCTVNPKRRWVGQGCRYKDNKEFYSDIQKYGWENFTKEILCEACNKKLAFTFETNFIKYFNTLENGYNRDFSTECCMKHKKKISKANKGKVFSEDHKKRISASCKGKVLSEEHKKRLSDAHIGIFSGDKNPCAKKVLNTKTGKEYSCLKYCATDLGVNYSTLKSGLFYNRKKYQHIQYIG